MSENEDQRYFNEISSKGNSFTKSSVKLSSERSKVAFEEENEGEAASGFESNDLDEDFDQYNSEDLDSIR